MIFSYFWHKIHLLGFHAHYLDFKYNVEGWDYKPNDMKQNNKGKRKMNPIIDELEKQYLDKELPALNPGDTVRVFVRIIEGNKERTQAFEGTILKKRGSGVGKTITVRKVFQGVGVERVFAIYSPRIEKITILKRGDVRRAKLYYLRDLSGKATRIKEKIEKR